MNLPAQKILSEIDSFLKRKDMAPSAFGKVAVGDPNLVQDLRAGRELRQATILKIKDFIALHKEEAS